MSNWYFLQDNGTQNCDTDVLPGMELQYFFHDDGRQKRHADILLGVELRCASEVECASDCEPDVLSANFLKFHYVVIKFYSMLSHCSLSPSTSYRTKLIYVFQIICFISIFIQSVTGCQRSETVVIFGGSAPHTDYILRRFVRTCFLHLHAELVQASTNQLSSWRTRQQVPLKRPNI